MANDNVQIQQAPDKTNAKVAAATKASGVATLLVGLLAGFLHAKGIVDLSDGITQIITGTLASVLVPVVTKYAGYMKNFDPNDFIQITRAGLRNKSVDVLSETLNDLDHKTGKRKKLKKILKGIGKAIKFLT